mmetsp:Transcript_27871/g.39877  ORF Transcript_27871/g.39877 Transcript_27871/m.39877 type:complete len:113 (-) Transcript_27871:222-560(-)
MFFLIAGSNQAVKNVHQPSIGPCLVPSCSGSIDLVEMGTTLYLFFIPVWTFTSEEQAFCRTCGFHSTPSNYQTMLGQRELLGLLKSCTKCGKTAHGNWAFCPSCGTEVAKQP